MNLLKARYFISPWLLQQLIWIPTRLLLIFCGHIKINGSGNLKLVPSNAIFACNHSSEMDVIVLPGSLPFFSRFSPVFYTSREREFYKLSSWRQRFYGGMFFKAWGAYPVEVGLNDYGKSLKTHIDIMRAGGSICIFPEGRTTRDGNIHEGKGGVSYLSYVTGRPIVPVRLDGLFRMSFGDFFFGRRFLSISFGQPMYMKSMNAVNAAEISLDEFKAYSNVVMDRIRSMAPSRPEVYVGAPVRVPRPQTKIA